MDETINKLIEHGRKTCSYLRTIQKLNPRDYSARVEELICIISAKSVACDMLDKDVKPLISLLEQTEQAINDVLGEANFEI